MKEINEMLGNSFLDFNQVIVNEYKPGQLISPHIDAKCFQEPVASVSLGQECVMKFSRDNDVKRFTLQDGSLILLTGDARYRWAHSLANNGPKTRYNITFRVA